MITQAELKRVLHYNPETGIFIWNISSTNRVRAGCTAGCVSFGYILIAVEGERYQAHRLAWLYTYGEWPKDEVDHINHVKTDNRIVNLREVNHKDNLKNQALYKNNKSDVCGVYRNKQRDKWQAGIRVNGKHIHLGLFTDKRSAATARKEAENKYGFHPNHGR